jgi:hypothetical protein
MDFAMDEEQARNDRNRRMAMAMMGQQQQAPQASSPVASLLAPVTQFAMMGGFDRQPKPQASPPQAMLPNQAQRM